MLLLALLLLALLLGWLLLSAGLLRGLLLLSAGLLLAGLGLLLLGRLLLTRLTRRLLLLLLLLLLLFLCLLTLPLLRLGAMPRFEGLGGAFQGFAQPARLFLGLFLRFPPLPLPVGLLGDVVGDLRIDALLLKGFAHLLRVGLFGEFPRLFRRHALFAQRFFERGLRRLLLRLLFLFGRFALR